MLNVFFFVDLGGRWISVNLSSEVRKGLLLIRVEWVLLPIVTLTWDAVHSLTFSPNHLIESSYPQNKIVVHRNLINQSEIAVPVFKLTSYSTDPPCRSAGWFK